MPMLNECPTDAQLKVARFVLEWLLERLRKEEPYATQAIQTLDDALCEMPESMSELDE